MNSRWNDHEARQAVDNGAGAIDSAVALRLYSASLLGSDPALVLHGGGNVSLKGTHRTLLGENVNVLYVKASGADMATLETDGLPGVRLDHLKRLETLDHLSDRQMVNEIRTHLLDASAPTPSIETLVHAWLPHRYVDHSHADAVLTLTNQPNGAELIRQAIGDRVGIVPYVKPGFDLAKAVAVAYRENPKVAGLVLLHHGLITFGDDAKTAYMRHISIVDACEKFIASKTKGKALSVEFKTTDRAEDLAARIAPVLRGLLAVPTGDEDHPYRRSVLEWRGTGSAIELANSKEAKTLCGTGPLTGDHLIRTKGFFLYLHDPDFADPPAFRKQLAECIEEHRRSYCDYVEKHGGSIDGIDPAPNVAVIPGAGVFAWGRSKRDARIAADIAEHTLNAKLHAHWIGSYEALPAEHLFDMEFRDLQRRKLDQQDKPLQGQVVAISGGAGAIGAAVALACARAGACVAIADISEDSIARAVDAIDTECGTGTALGLTMDVTNESSVREGFARIARTFGGVDVVVPNAGIAHVSSIENMAVADFRRVMEVNATGYLLFMREGIRILKQQGLGGHIIISASKNVFGPGKDFGAYSASKAAGHQLGKVAALELAPDGIRVNMINADAVFGDEQTPSGLWATVGPQRAKSRNMNPDQLPDYYRQRNLLKTRIGAHHVANAVIFFATNATPTTGATLPVDGGVVEAFPR